MRQDAVIHIISARSLPSHADGWDALWRQSEVTQPTARAASVAQWVDTFGDAQSFRALVLRSGDRHVAALPLINRRVGRLVNAYDLPGNDWSPAGDLLLDEREDTAALCDQLVAELTFLPRSLFWFDSVPTGSARWQQFMAALDRAHVQTHLHPRYDVGWLDTRRNWQQTEAGWSSSFRRRLRKCKQRLEQEGPLELEVLRPRGEPELTAQLMPCLKLEDAGWKGRAGTSILSSKRVADFFLAQAGQLADWGYVEISLLKQNDRMLACGYAWRTKQVYHAFKVAYDEQYAKFSPGQLLMQMVLQRQSESPEYCGIDCMGPINDALLHWRPEPRGVGRLVFAPGRPVGRAFLCAYRHLSPSWRRIRDAVRPVEH